MKFLLPQFLRSSAAALMIFLLWPVEGNTQSTPGKLLLALSKTDHMLVMVDPYFKNYRPCARGRRSA